MLFIGLQAVAGGFAVTIAGFAIFMALRNVVSPGELNLRIITIPGTSDVPIELLLGGVILFAILGASLLLRGESQASKASIDLAQRLRLDVFKEVSKPMSRGWPSAFARPPGRLIYRVCVSLTREISVAARDIIGLGAPVALTAVLTLALFGINPLVTLIMLPIGSLYALPVYFMNRGVQELNEEILTSQKVAQDKIETSVQALSEHENELWRIEGDEEAVASDRQFHERMLQPIRLRAISTVGMAFMAVIMYLLWEWRTPPGQSIDFEPFIIYLILMRFAANGVTQFAKGVLTTARRLKAIDEYQEFMADIERYRNSRIERSTSDSALSAIQLPDGRDGTLALRRGEGVLVVTRREPTKALIDSLLVCLEEDQADRGRTIDILGDSEITFDHETKQQHHFVGKPDTDTARPTFNIVVAADPLSALLSSDADFTITVCRISPTAFDSALEDWAHIFAGIIAFDDGEVVSGGNFAWVRQNRDELRSQLRPTTRK